MLSRNALEAKKRALEDFKETAKFNRTLEVYKSNAKEKSIFQHNQIDLLAKDLETNDSAKDRFLFEKKINKYEHELPNNQVIQELMSIRNLAKATRAYYGSNFDVSPLSLITAISMETIEDPGAWKKYNATRNKRSQPICSDYGIGSDKKCR